MNNNNINGHHTNGNGGDSTIEKMQDIINSLKEELHSLKDLVKKHERRIFKLESERNDVDGDSND